MSDQYYYLLDGKEHGPFSRAAIEQLMSSGKVDGALLKSSSDKTWRAPDEIGLGAKSEPNAQPTQADGDPATLVFRSQREITASKPSNVAGTTIGGLLLIAFVGYGAWLSAKQKDGTHNPADGSQPTVQANTNTESVSEAQAAADAAAAADDADDARLETDDVCADLVDEILGPNPGNSCGMYWSSYAMRIRAECGAMKQLASQDPRNGSVQSMAVRSVIEKKYDKLYEIGGQYQLKMPGHCR